MSGPEASAIVEKLAEDGAQAVAPAANLRLVEHGAALHEKCPPELAELFEGAGAEGLDAEAGIAQGLRGGVDGGAGFGSDGNEAVVFEEADGVGAEFIERWLAQRHAAG